MSDFNENYENNSENDNVEYNEEPEVDMDDVDDENASELSDAIQRTQGAQILTDQNQAELQVERITPNFLTKYEKARAIGTRALQISKNSPVLVDLGKDDYDPIMIAERELAEKKIPFVIRRFLPDGSYEDWKLSELEILDRFQLINIYFTMFLILMIFIKILLSGKIFPSDTNSIYNTISNAGQYTDYKFNFKTESGIEINDEIHIVFPSQFPEVITNQKIQCNYDCTINNREVIIQISKQFQPDEYVQIIVFNILNPSEQGGVANFYIRIFSGGFLKDQNLRFGIIGISQQINKLSSASVFIDQKGVNKAGLQNRINFKFKTLNQIPSNIFIRLYFPKDIFKIENLPSCQSDYINGNLIKGVLQCQKLQQQNWDIIDVYGIEDELNAQTIYQISILITNPTYEMITDNFGIAIIKNKTNVILQNDMNIKGIEIVPANINDIQFYSIQNNTLITRNKEMRFRLSFTLTNFLKEQNVIKISVPVSIKIQDFKISEKSNNFFIETGLNKKKDQQIQFELDNITNQILITNFEPKFDNELISILMYIQTPDNQGLSSPLLIQTLTQKEAGYIIDQDSQFATFYVQDIKSPKVFSIQLSDNSVYENQQIIGEIKFSTEWTQTIPQNGFIKIILPDEISARDVKTSNCLVQNSDNELDIVESQDCFKIDSTIFIQIKSQFFKDKQRSFILKDCIIHPQVANRYLLDITSYLEDKQSPIESYQQPVNFISYLIQEPNFRILGNEQKQTAMINLFFQVPIQIHNSILPHQFTIPYSFIDILIEADGNFSLPQDLNYGLPNGSKIPCDSYKDLISPQKIQCTLMTNDIPTIRIENFNELIQNSEIGILIPNFYNLQGNTKITVKIIENQNDQYIEKCHFTQVIQILNQLLPETLINFGYLQNHYQLYNKIIGQDNIIQFNLKFQDKVSNQDSIIIEIPFYQEGYCQNNNIKCFIQEQEFDCICISNIDWVWIELSEFDELGTNEVQIKLQGLKNPQSVCQGKLYFKARIINKNGATKRIYQYPIFDKLIAQKFDQIDLIPEIQKLKTDSIYTIRFISNLKLPQNIIIIEFPYMYDLTQSNPSIRIDIIINDNYLKDYNIRIATNKITLENIPSIQINQVVLIKIKGINNPNYDGQIYDFNLQVLNNDYFLIIENKNFAQFFLSLPLEIKSIQLREINSFPLNAAIQSRYKFDINLTGSILKGSYLTILFPDGFKNLPLYPNCNISGAINSFLKCQRSFQEIQIILNRDYIYKEYDSNILIQIDNIINSDFGIQKYFKIQISYSDQIIYQTIQQDHHQVDIVQQPQKIQILNYEFTPQNEAEINTLTINFLPFTSIDIQSQIILIFPQIFDDEIGDELTITLELFKKKQLTFIKGIRQIVIDDLFPYTPNEKSPLILKIIGIVNPNQYNQIFQQKDYFIEMGIRQKQNNYYTDYSENQIKLDVQKAPGQLTIHNIEFNNLYCRYQSNIKFNVTFNQALPKEEVESFFIIDFPNQFNNEDGEVKAKSYSEDWLNLKSKFISNKLYSTGNMQDYKGNFVGKIFGINNPQDQTVLGAFNCKTYDQRNKKIIERSYSNINPFDYKYIYPGPLIIINDDKDIILYKGTQSDPINIYIEDQAALNLSIVPSNKKFTFYPNPININIGAKYKQIQISIPQDFKSGDYIIDWKIEGEKYPKIYTPIKQSKIIVKQKLKLKIILQKYDKIPFTGQSLPYIFELEYAPDIQIQIEVNFKKDYEGLKLSKNILIFKPNKKIDSFYIYFEQVQDSKKVIDEGSIDLKMSGINKDIYQMDIEELNFVIDAIDNEKGEITKFNMIDFDKNWAKFQFSSSKIGIIYYLIVLKGTQQPTIQHLKNRQLKYDVIFKQFGEVYIYENDLDQKNFKIENLLPSYEYIIYYFFENLTGISAKQPYQFEFKTKERYKTADISLRLNQTFLYPKEELEILKHISLVLSLPEDKIAKKYINNENFIDEGRRLQQNNLQESMKIFFFFNIIPVPENPYYPSPKILGDSLNEKLDMLKSRIQQLDITYRIQSSEFYSPLPKFVINPYVKDFDYEKVILEFQFNNIGWLYAIAIENSDINLSQNITPFQIFLGVDYYNQQTPYSKLEVLRTYQNIDIQILNLKPETFYEIFLIVADSDPGYKNLDSQKEIKRFQIVTLEAPQQDFLYLQSNIYMSIIIILLLLNLLQLILQSISLTLIKYFINNKLSLNKIQNKQQYYLS